MVQYQSCAIDIYLDPGGLMQPGHHYPGEEGLTTMSEKYGRLKTLLAEINDLDAAIAILTWDREVNMPPGGVEGRANQLATLSRLRHASFTSDELGTLLDDLSSASSDLDPDGDEARIISVTKRDYDIERKQPASLVEAVSRASSAGLEAWSRAKEAQDFSIFAPCLKRNAELSRETAEALGYTDRPYDALVDRYEPGMTTAQLETIFSELKAAILPLVEEITASGVQPDDSCLRLHYDPDTQIRFSLDIATRFGYDLNRGRLDTSAHPFATSFGAGDVRMTTRVQADFLNRNLFATMHESGHAVYEQGIGANLSGTLVAHGASGGVHESQSRLWENLVGRSRPCQDFLFPRLQQTYPGQLGDMDIETFYRAINKVHPSLNRVEADEVTYNLHILLRFELENDMLEGRADIDRLDEVWVERMRKYLGVTPPDPVQGVLQDIHWSYAGEFGTFPSYTLGNVIGAQLFAQARKEMPDLDTQIASGQFSDLLGWLQTNLYRHGRKFTPNELLQRITGQPLGTQAWVSYVRGKYTEIYGL
jgi:carboxypeptidase Taq